MLLPAIAKIVQGPKTLGTAFAISQDYALTAFHCIGNRKTGAVEVPQQILQFPHCDPIESEYVSESGSHLIDFAVLKMKNPLPQTFRPFPLVSQAFLHASWNSQGHPSTVQGPTIPTVVSGKVENPDGELFGEPAIQLHCEQAAHGLLLNGLSGAPVQLLVHGKPAGVVGLIRWNPMDAANPSVTLPGGIVYACPVSAVLQRCTFLDATVLPDVSEAEQIADLRELRRRLSNEAMKTTVDQALEKANRSATLRGTINPYQPDWIPIPALSYHVNKNTGIQYRDVVKGFTGAIAYGIRHLSPPDAAELQFVFLIHSEENQAEIRLNLLVPFQRIVGYVRDVIEDPRGMEREGANEGRVIDIRYNYRIAPGAYFPIVAVYRPVVRYLEFANANQIDSPAQFLSPHLCRTTSGFLNFLGVLDIRRLVQKSQSSGDSAIDHIIQFDNLPEAMNKGLDSWFRWLYCFMDTGTLLDPSRLYVSAKNPEGYDYRYYSKQESSESVEKWSSEQ